MIRLRIVLYGIAREGNVIKTFGDYFIYYHGAWIRISRRMFWRIVRRYRLVDSRIVDDNTIEFLLVRKKPKGLGLNRPSPLGSGF